MPAVGFEPTPVPLLKRLPLPLGYTGLVLPTGFEPALYGLSTRCLCHLGYASMNVVWCLERDSNPHCHASETCSSAIWDTQAWSGWPDSNRHPHGPKPCALPLSYNQLVG